MRDSEELSTKLEELEEKIKQREEELKAQGLELKKPEEEKKEEKIFQIYINIYLKNQMRKK